MSHLSIECQPGRGLNTYVWDIVKNHQYHMAFISELCWVMQKKTEFSRSALAGETHSQNFSGGNVLTLRLRQQN